MLEPERERERGRQDATWIAWLRTMRWDFFATPSFRHPTGGAAMLRAVAEWLKPLGPKAYAAIGCQHGPLGDRLHVHLLCGGVGRRRDTEALLRWSWRRGNIHLVGFTPQRGAIDYVVAQADEIELLGTPVAYRPRR